MGRGYMEEVRPRGDAFVYFSICGSGVQKEAVGSKDSFKDRYAGEGVKMREAWSKGVGWCDRDGGGGVNRDIWRFQVGASVFVAPVECWGDWEGFAWGEVDRLDAALARWAADFHDKGEGG